MPSKLNELKKEIQQLRPPRLLSDGVHATLVEVPTGLEDILAVLGDGYANETTRINKGIFYWKFDSPEVGFDWLLGKPLDDQSEETINFLHSLIVN